MTTIKREFAKLKKAQRDYNRVNREFKRSIQRYSEALPIKGGECVTIRETGEVIILARPFIYGTDGRWSVDSGYHVHEDGTRSKTLDFIIRPGDSPKHFVLNGVEYTCGIQEAIEF